MSDLLHTCLSLYDGIAPGRLAEPRGAHLGRALLRLAVHVHQPVAVAEPGGPLAVVHQAPQEVTLDRHACPSRNADTDTRYSPFLRDHHTQASCPRGHHSRAYGSEGRRV